MSRYGERMKSNTGDLVAIIAAMLAGVTLNMDAAIGATFGMAFFLLSNGHHPFPRRIGYASVSACVGYASGIAAGAPWSMLASATCAAVAVVSLASLADAIKRNGLAAILEIWRSRK